MTQWEYRVAPVPGGTDALQAALDELGAEGWELVTCAFHPGQLRSWTLVLKRPAAAS